MPACPVLQACISVLQGPGSWCCSAPCLRPYLPVGASPLRLLRLHGAWGLSLRISLLFLLGVGPAPYCLRLVTTRMLCSRHPHRSPRGDCCNFFWYLHTQEWNHTAPVSSGDSVEPDSFPELDPVSRRPQQQAQFPASQVSQWDRHKAASCRCDEHFSGFQ